MAKFAIKHKGGLLVSSIGTHLINLAGDFKGAMTFSSKKEAQATVDYMNAVTSKNGAKGVAYSVCEKSQYKKPAYLKKTKKAKHK